MEVLSDLDPAQLQQQYGPLLACRLEFSAFEIQEDLGTLTLDDHRYSGYLIDYGTARGPHLYCMLNAADRETAVAEGTLSLDYRSIHWGPDDPEWSPAHGRLMNRLRRETWSSFAGGEQRLPKLGSPLSHYPGDGEMLCPQPQPGPEARTAEERLYIDNPRAWFQQTGFPDAAAGYTFPADEGEYDHVACFLYAMKTNNAWSVHDGPLEKIAHLYDDPTQDQFLGRLDDALKIFDDFEGDDLMTRCVMTRNRARQIHLTFADGRTLTFHRLILADNLSDYQLKSAEEVLVPRVRYEQIVAALETWPLPEGA